MNSFLVISLILGLLTGTTCYFASNSLIMAACVGGVFFFGIWLLCGPMIAQFYKTHRKRHEQFRFINSFVVTLSVTKSVDMAYATAIEGLGKEIESLSDSLSELAGLEKVEYLESYFLFPIYRMFLSTLSIYMNEGGDIIGLSSQLLAELTRIEESENDILSANRKNLLQFTMFWAISLVVILFLRVGLQSFYDQLTHSVMFLACIGAYYGLMFVSILIYFNFYTGVPIRIPFAKKEKRPAPTKGANA